MSLEAWLGVVAASGVGVGGGVAAADGCAVAAELVGVGTASSANAAGGSVKASIAATTMPTAHGRV